jgi:hypothetical protein
MEDVGIFYGHLVYFTAIWYILRPFGVFYGYLGYFAAIWQISWEFGLIFPILVRCTKKNLAALPLRTEPTVGFRSEDGLVQFRNCSAVMPLPQSRNLQPIL